MKRKAFLNVAVSSLIMGTTMVGCAAFNPSRVSNAAVQNPAKLVAMTEQALGKHDAVKAVTAAEAAVAADPQNAAYRTMLGRAYLLAGRYASAETSFSDAMTLGAKDPRTIVSLALVQVANGKAAAARNMLDTNRENLPAVDFGLAIALAGDADEGVRVLGEVIRDPASGAKARQNLGYAYALAGRWPEAKLMAQQDLSPEAAQERILAWARTAQAGSEPQRIAALTGVNPVASDAGLPVRLALNSNAGAPVQTAAAEPVATPAPVAAPVETPSEPTAIASFAEATPAPEAPAVVEAVAKPEPTPVQIAEGAKAVMEARPIAAPIIRAPATPIRTAAVVRRGAEETAVARRIAFEPTQSTGGKSFVVQLGAYNNAAVAREKWRSLASRNADIARFPVVATQATVRGRNYHRLAISGFATAQTASAMCSAIRAQGNACFVRAGDPGVKAERWALAKPRQFAAR